MEAAGNGSGGGEAQLLISGVGGDQPLVMSAEDAAQFLAQAGLQLADVTDGTGQVIINSGDLESAGLIKDEQGIQLNVGEQQIEGLQQGAVEGADFNDGTVLYIDPNDPQAAALLQQAGLTIADDGTVIGGIEEAAVHQEAVQQDEVQQHQQQQIQQQQVQQQQSEVITSDPPAETQLGTIMEGAPENASTEVPQELFMSSDELESKTGLTLEAAEQKIVAEELGSTLIQQDNTPQLSTETATTSVTTPRMTPGQQSPKKVVVSAPLKESPVVTSAPKMIKSRIVQASPQHHAQPVQQQPQQQQQQIIQQHHQPQQQQQIVQPQQSQVSNSTTITVGPDQQQVFYTVSGEDGKTQQYMMLCPKDMDQNTLIQTLVRQITADPSNKGKKTIRITQHRSASGAEGQPAAAAVQQQQPPPQQSAQPQSAPVPKRPRQTTNTATSTPKTSRQSLPTASRSVVSNQSKEINNRIGQILSATENNMTVPKEEPPTILDSAETFESVVPELSTDTVANNEDVRVYVRCNYCPDFRSTLNGETWEAILNHILPVAKEEIQTTFYGDLEKHFYRSVRLQVNGRQMVRTRTPSGSTELNIPQVEVVLTHSLVCRKTRREFIVSPEPDASFVANLAKHIRQMQPGTMSARANSLLCIFCNSPFTYEDYLRHIQPYLETILATLCCFSGAYCASTYENNVRATKACQGCQESEPADLRFLPCVRFSAEYQCLSKLQFAIECFRENYGENGFMRLNTNNLARCSVCKNNQQVYCALFHITSTIVNEADDSTRDIDTQLSVCVNCQKQFINIVMKEQNFDDRLKQFQLRNMEQLCSCLRVILGQAKAISEGRKTLIYTVQEGNSSSPSPSAVHTVKLAEITDIQPITRLIALAESDVLASPVKAFYMCDLCMFTIDLTSILATPTATQKNEMLLAIVLEHLVPHTESLLSVIANTAGSKTFHFKMEIKAKVSEQNHQRKIILSLQKKFVSASSGLEIVLEKDEERTLSQLRASVRNERNRSFVNIRTKSDGSTITTTTPSPSGGSNASQLVDVNKFIDKQKGKLSILAQCGCNTHLLSSYTECRLCSKFCFPDFRLSGASQQIDLCENCVETVLTLCLPTDPEVLENGEECLALNTSKVVGHRLVLANNVKKWLSLDGVNLIKKTVEEFNSNSNSIFSRIADCGPIFSEALKQHLLANLKTCYSDEDITTAVTGFTVTEDFFKNAKYTGRDAETAAALASLQEQTDMSIREADSSNRNIIIRRRLPERQIEVKILERRPPGSKKTPIPIRIGPPLRGSPRSTAGASPIMSLAAASPASNRVSNGGGMVIDLGGNRKSLVISPAGHVTNIINRRSTEPQSVTSAAVTSEESVSAIQSFIEETASASANNSPIKQPSPSVRITSTATGVVNIKAVSDGVVHHSPSPAASQIIRQTSHHATSQVPRGRGRPPKTPNTSQNINQQQQLIQPQDIVGSVRNMKGVSMVTLTAGGIIKKVTQPPPSSKRTRTEFDSGDEGDSDDLYDDDLEDEDSMTAENSRINNGSGKKSSSSDDREYRPPRKVIGIGSDPNDSLDDSASGSNLNTSGNNGGNKRARKEKKIFDL